MNRRWALGGVALAAGAAGVGGALWHERRTAEQLAAATGGLWAQKFPQPSGNELLMGTLLGKPLVLNFWATWCPPCVKEMPEIDRFQRAFAARGWQVLGLAIDGPTPVRDYLAKRPVSYAIGLAGLEGNDLMRALGNPLGGLPFTVAFGSDGLIRRQKIGETSYDELAEWAASIG
jgi:thiol-disulfide isomerase/thioredoxin